MIKRRLLYVIVACVPAYFYAGDMVLLDTIQATVYGPISTDIITASDTRRPGIDGAIRTLDDLIFQGLVYQSAAQINMLQDEEAVDKLLKQVQQEHNLTTEQLHEIFRNAGYTPEEGKEQFRIMSAANQMIGFRVLSRVIVPENEILRYWEENPVYTEPAYYIRRAEIPFSVADTRESLKKQLCIDSFYEHLAWSKPFWIEKDDVAVDKDFIHRMKKGQLFINNLAQGFEVFELVDKRERELVPLEERREEIVQKLRQPKYKELMEEYKKELFDNAAVLYLNPPSL